jgi:hypothetical protein
MIGRMAHDEELAERIRGLLAAEPDIREKRMFGGLAFLAGGHIAVGASGRGGLMARVDPDEQDALLAHPHVGDFEMNGGPTTGWLRVDAAGLQDDAELEPWVSRGLAIARSLPPKD